ncbi:MAG: hypothetical protein HY593_01945 [Candidatus Omnitrophica bacterium]|nr:hypothetical protein [Candidatus Omnitrophota bacterium]
MTSHFLFDKLKSMRCDTCGKEVTEVSRVMVDAGYDRTLARPLYNCPECFKKKEEAKARNRNQQKTPPA